MNSATFQDLMAQILEIRTNWIPDTPGVPKTRPTEGPYGKEMCLSLPEREIRVLVHQPDSAKPRYPVYFNFHGGGMCAGSAEIDEFLCNAICAQAECVVVNVEYRLAPEHPFPHGLNDAYDTIQYVLSHAGDFLVNKDKVAMGGQSAGANLAAACSIRANRSGDFRYTGLVLCYPGLSFAPRDSSKPIAGAVPKKTGALYAACYALGGGDMQDPLASPVFAAPDDVKDTPGALIVSAELDALRLDAEAYARILARAGVPVLYKQFQNCVHGFTHRAYAQEPQQAIRLMATYLRSCWTSL